MSLRTGDRRTAIRRALALDLALEEVMLMEAPPPGLTIRTLLVNLRNELVLEGEMERASRPTAPSAAFGTPPASNPTGLAESSLADLMALSEMPLVPDEDLIEEHPLGRRSSGDAPAAGVSTATDGVPPPDLATPARRAAFFAGLSHYMTQAVRRNDLELADGVVERLLDKHAPGVPLDGTARNLLRRSALRTLAEVHGINARRERGDYGAFPADDPTLDMPLTPAIVRPGTAEKVEAPTVAPTCQERGKLLSEVHEEYERYMMSSLAKSDRWTNQTKLQNAMTIRLLIEFAGDRPINGYGEDEARSFKVALEHLPRMHGRSPDWRVPMRDAVKRVKALVESGENPPECLAMKTIKRHMSALSGLFSWVKERPEDYGYRGANHFQGHRYGRSEVKRWMWETEDLQALFNTPIWTGCDLSRRAKPGTALVYNAYYWLPLLATYHGLRQEEIAQLRASDIQEEDGIWFINIHSENGNHVKTEAGERRVPIHSYIISLGFLDYVSIFRRNSDDHLWPTLKRGGPDKKFAHYYTQRFTEYCRQTGIYDESRPFHALRASFRTFLEDTQAKSVHISKVVGHSLTTELGEGGRYTKKFNMSTLKQVVDKFDPKVNLPHLVRFDPAKHRIKP